jgi:hypothetical protein
MIEGADLDDLVSDVHEYGLREPIVVFEDKILDGRNRYRACVAAGVEPAFTIRWIQTSRGLLAGLSNMRGNNRAGPGVGEGSRFNRGNWESGPNSNWNSNCK